MPLFHPDNRTVMVLTEPEANGRASAYFVPIDGGPPRAVVTLGDGERFNNASISPDGRMVLYVMTAKARMVFVDFDLGAGLTGRPPGVK